MSTRGAVPEPGTVAAIGARAAARREELGLTQAQLARQIGVSREWVIRFERGNPGANLEGVLRALSELQLEVSTRPKAAPASRRTTQAARFCGKEGHVMKTATTAEKPITTAPTCVLVDSLDKLHGPAEGEVTLPNRLLWNPSRPFDLSDDKRARSLLRIVLREARRPEDIENFVNRERLAQLWGKLNLPEYIAQAWEEKFPELARASELTLA